MLTLSMHGPKVIRNIIIFDSLGTDLVCGLQRCFCSGLKGNSTFKVYLCRVNWPVKDDFKDARKDKLPILHQVGKTKRK